MAATVAAVPGVQLSRTGDHGAAIDALAATLAADGGGRVGVDGLYDDLPRRLRRSRAPHPRLLGRAVDRAFTWDAHDRRDEDWWPQGITTSAETGFAERHGHDVLLTSWYAKHDAGARVSMVDLDRRRYAHVLLVVPTLGEDGSAGLTPLRVHAGGLVWHGPHLHVAATGRGLHTARIADVLRVPAGSALQTYGHRYVLPVWCSHRSDAEDGTERLRHSFLTLDRSGAVPRLLVGEYGSARRTRRFARFALDPVTGLPDALPAEVDDRGEVRMQGVAVVDGVLHVTSSRGPWGPGSVFTGRPGALAEHRWALPMGPEDLVWWPETGGLWSVTEHPRRRWIVRMAPDAFAR